ncbi:MAG TPA: hypothetical protein VK579_03300 [Terriglobales bacterium]|nr:hypothetical protein [Terriglobales bacterium]
MPTSAMRFSINAEPFLGMAFTHRGNNEDVRAEKSLCRFSDKCVPVGAVHSNIEMFQVLGGA